jgi:hypothetical protein
MAGRRDPLPWAVAAIALVALIAMLAGGRFSGARQTPAAPEQQTAASAQPTGPNLSQMTPDEITNRLFDRIMMLHEAGKDDSAKFLALNMGIPAFEMHDSLTIDLRYHLGRIAEVTGIYDLAKAQADTILREHPNHLLALALAANVARHEGKTALAKSLDKQLIKAETSELALRLEEYEAHKVDLDSALAVARRGGS